MAFSPDRSVLGLNIMFDVEAKSVHGLLSDLQSKLDPFHMGTFLHGLMVPHLNRSFKAGFDSERAPDGSGWAPLTDATVQIRKDAGFGGAHPINVRGGELERYITQSSGTIVTTGTDAILKYPSERGVPSGSLGKKVRGAQKGEGKAPPRPVLGLNEADLAFLLAGLMGYVQTAGKRVSGQVVTR